MANSFGETSHSMTEMLEKMMKAFLVVR